MPGSWPSPSSKPHRISRDCWPAGCLEPSQHCSAFSPRSPAPGGSRRTRSLTGDAPGAPSPRGHGHRPAAPPPVIPARRRCRPAAHHTGSDLVPPGRGRDGWPAGCFEGVAALHPAICRPRGQAAGTGHSPGAPSCPGLGHHPAASLTGSAGTAGQRDASSHRSTAAPSPLDHLLQGAAAGPDHSQVMHQAHHRPGDMAIALQRPRQ